ncbi:ATP-binding protein [Streptomyces sp. MUM 203J]|uniref:ATP-binding protein n=1 Tax=Streptomyces sp. MUM 203J TaxID=2791990 RepID=UPI001F03A468|nr:ATP-binding protein [Streptomyces sp. MUM 203J]MCH0540460.1 ATP-binding protein [Streptomyces sp. MUM 203J]
MTFSGDSESRLRCVLPFEAVPGEVRLLRRAVRSALGRWGVLCAVDEAELVVTELATNVIKHVGEGVPATLVLEVNGDRLRVELHDLSPLMPDPGGPGTCNAECGRGLHLLASVSTGWGTLAAEPGKAVWCELSLVADAMRSRARRAATVVEGYRGLLGFRGSIVPTGSRVDQEAAATLIADLLVWLALQGGDPDMVLDRAQQLFEGDEAA